MPARACASQPQRLTGPPAVKNVMAQIVIGIIVTVVGTVIADAILRGGKGGKKLFGGAHYSGSHRAGR